MSHSKQTLTADDILGTKTNAHANFFTGSLFDVKKAFHDLVTEWHPDHSSSPRASDVFAHLVTLRDAAVKRLNAADGTDERKPKASSPGRIIEAADGRCLETHPVATIIGDLGDILVGHRTITTIFRPENITLALSEMSAIKSFGFADDKLKTAMMRFLPTVVREFPLKDGGYAMIVERKPDDVMLSDLLRMSGPLAPEHAAWLCSGLLNIACWLEWAGVSHGAFDPRHILISPEQHSVSLVGGWAFSTPIGMRATALPERTIAAVPVVLQSGRKADATIDLELIRLTIRGALGDPTGAGLFSGSVPKPIARWLTFPPLPTAYTDYAAWQKALSESWSGRRFTVLDIHPADIYGE